MSAEKESQPAKPRKRATENGSAVGLDEDAIRNLTGFFDVLIRMDFAQKQRNERNDGNVLQDTTGVATKVD